ncbi:FldB/FldC dehydratase alpha/beta subunit like protein, partial [Aduncisulcus paluster]
QGLAANLEEAEERVREGGLRERERVCGFVLDDQCEEREKEEEEKGEDDCSIITSAHSTLPSPCASLPDSEKVSPVGSSKGSEEEESVGEEKEVQGVVALQEDSS